MQEANDASDNQSKVVALLQEYLETGEEGLFDELYYALQDQLFRYVISRVRNRTVATEILQDTFVDLWQALQRFSYRGEAQFYGLVFTITKRKIARTVKQLKRTPLSLDERMDTGFDVKNEREHHEEAEQQEYIRSIVNQLKDTHRDVLQLRYWSQLSFKEIGDILGCSEQAARVRHHRALDVLAKHLERNDHE